MRPNFWGLIGLIVGFGVMPVSAKDWQDVTVGDIQKNIITTYDEWFGGDAPPLSQDEVESMVCMFSAGSMGSLITVVGGTAIVISGSVSSATSTAIALPVLISSMWAACSLGKALLPGMLWLERRSKMLVDRLSGAVTAHPTPRVVKRP